MKRKLLFAAIALLSFTGGRSAAQGIAPQDMEKFKKMEDSLVVSADSMYEAFLPDTRVMYSERFTRQLVRTLKIPNSYLYTFDTLQKLINIFNSDDNSFRIFNWVIEPAKISRRYYGAIQLNQPQLKLIGLNDYSEQLDKGLEDSTISGGKWFGALYYRIMTREVKGQKVHFLFGLNSGGLLSNRKVIDPMTFSPTGSGVTFGAPVFGIGSHNFPKTPVKRFVLEYKKDVSASMNWDQERQMIVFDKLTSVSNDPNRKYTYVPSGQYDGLYWANEMWNLKRDLVDITVLQDGQAPGGE